MIYMQKGQSSLNERNDIMNLSTIYHNWMTLTVIITSCQFLLTPEEKKLNGNCFKIILYVIVQPLKHLKLDKNEWEITKGKFYIPYRHMVSITLFYFLLSNVSLNSYIPNLFRSSTGYNHFLLSFVFPFPLAIMSLLLSFLKMCINIAIISSSIFWPPSSVLH